MRGLTLALCLVATTAAAQQPVPTTPDSARAESIPPPVPPTPEQVRYLQGLRTAGRGIAQLKDGVSRVTTAGRDTVRLKQAALRLAGLCNTARGFMTAGRAKMQASAYYEDSTRIKARRLTAQIDSLIRYATTCDTTAGKHPASTEVALRRQIPAYDAALKDFRAAIGWPGR
jgi:hypothetical protein